MLRQSRLAGGVTFSTCPSVRSSVRPSVRYQTCKHDILKPMNRFRCKLAQVIRVTRAWHEGQRSRSHDRGQRYIWRLNGGIIRDSLALVSSFEQFRGGCPRGVFRCFFGYFRVWSALTRIEGRVRKYSMLSFFYWYNISRTVEPCKAKILHRGHT